MIPALRHPPGRIVDLFCGAGGWAVGMDLLGIDPATTIGLDTDPDAVATHNAAGFDALLRDVSKAFPVERGGGGLVASPPCQAFSFAGRGKGRENIHLLLEHVDACREQGWTDPTGPLVDEDVRADLTLQPLRWASLMEPDWIALEQVGAVMPAFEAMASVFETWGYSTWCGKLDAEEYGVPQTRSRAVVIANRHRAVDRPPRTHTHYYARRKDKGRHDLPGMIERKGGGRAEEAGLLPWISMADALGWDPDQAAERLFAGTGVTAEQRVGQVQRPAASAPAHTITTKATAAWVFVRPSTTIVGSFRPDVIAAPGYRKAGDGPRQNAVGSVQVSPDEAAVLQSFPADHPWHGKRNSVYRQIGNAVPPRLAAHVLSAAINGTSGPVEVRLPLR